MPHRRIDVDELALAQRHLAFEDAVDVDLDVGKKPTADTNASFIQVRSASGQSGTGTGSAEFLLATYTVTVAAGTGSNDATFNLVLPGQGGTGTVTLGQPIGYKQDTSDVGGGTSFNNLANVTVGAPVVVTVPEPATVGLLALVGVPALLRRRPR